MPAGEGLHLDGAGLTGGDRTVRRPAPMSSKRARPGHAEADEVLQEQQHRMGRTDPPRRGMIEKELRHPGRFAEPRPSREAEPFSRSEAVERLVRHLHRPGSRRTASRQQAGGSPKTVDGSFFATAPPSGFHGFGVQLEAEREVYIETGDLRKPKGHQS